MPLPGNALIHTREGLVSIAQVKVGMDVLTPTGYSKVTAWSEQGLQPIFTIVTAHTQFSCTVEHPMAIAHERKHARELRPGDCLLQPLRAIEGRTGYYPCQQSAYEIGVLQLPKGGGCGSAGARVY